jgi:hypothetical protein
MKNKNYTYLINSILIFWIFLWVYYLAFNWSVFSVELRTNLGFAVVSSHPFLFFSVLGLILLIALKYIHHIISIQQRNVELKHENETRLLKKDIEILQLKEVLFKMQTKEMNQNSSALLTLHEKLDKITDQYADSRNDKITQTEENTEKEKEKNQDTNQDEK